MKTAEEILRDAQILFIGDMVTSSAKSEMVELMKSYAKQRLEEYRDALLENLPRTSNNDMIKYRVKAGIYILNKDINHFIK